MRIKSTLPIVTLGALLLAAVSVQRPALAGTADLATVSTTSGGVHWQPLLPTDGWILTVAGEDRWIRSQFGPGESPAFQPVDESGQPLPDGQYTWELRTVQRQAGIDPDAAANGRDAASEGVRPTQGPTTQHPAARLTQSGAFTIANGAIVSGGVEATAAPETPAADTGGGSSEELVIAEDLIVQGSECVGVDCVNGESFGADTIRLKENNLRIHFLDTSNTGSFPSNDWRLVANDQADGGRNIFFLEDATSGREVFSVEAGAPTSSLYVDDGGRVGFGTSTPVLQLQTTDGNTPALRLEQDGSSGFTPQTWDVAGNEANFFVRDVTGGSRLPLRIRPGAPTSSVDISPNGVGIGTATPAAALDIHNLTGSGNTAVRLTNGATTWSNAVRSDGAFVFNILGSGGSEFTVRQRLDGSGSPTLDVDGSVRGTQFISTSSREVKTAFDAVNPVEVLANVAKLPVSAWRYIWEGDSAHHVGPVAEDFHRLFGLGDGKTIGTVDADGVLMAAVQGLLQKMTSALAAKDAEIAALSTRLHALEEEVRDRGTDRDTAEAISVAGP